MNNLLEVNNLKTSFYTQFGEVQAVGGVSFNLEHGEVMGIVGESGSGKSVTMMSIMRLLDDNGKVKDGKVRFEDKDIVSISEEDMSKIRGNEISMIFQDPMTSLNPLMTIGNQIMEPLRIHKKMTKEEAYKKAVELLHLVGIPSPESRMKQYPHEFSGGMRQRVMIAMALTCNPKLLIADEPTTALDVTIQAQILEIMKDIKQKLNTSIILITHDLGVVADICDNVNVMYGGLIIEQGTVQDIFYNSKHPYTWGLMESVPNPNTLVRERLRPIDGQPPDLFKPPKGCPFYARCKYSMEVCKEHKPRYYEISQGHQSACWLNDKRAPKVETPIKRRKEDE
ncbi:ABC transporter ATP-binding protein [Clostridium subterminale]|uniref:ABC transporter ATP-binding protein n=1 Tax=Clostridium subterminale TaxID=1550 RepID=A0ABN1KHN6_CLOSU